MEKLVRVEGFNKYMVDIDGKIYKVTTKGVREVSQNMDRYGFLRVNLQKDDKMARPRVTTKPVHTIVYESFKGKAEGGIIFLDDNKENCKLENLVSLKDLIECYKANCEGD